MSDFYDLDLENNVGQARSQVQKYIEEHTHRVDFNGTAKVFLPDEHVHQIAHVKVINHMIDRDGSYRAGPPLIKSSFTDKILAGSQRLFIITMYNDVSFARLYGSSKSYRTIPKYATILQ